MKTDHKHRFAALSPCPREDEASAQIEIVCKLTRTRLPWNKAARSGWCADLNGPAFNAYYSPQAIAQLLEGSK